MTNINEFFDTEVDQSPKGKGFYLLPNLFTMAGLFAGFYAVVAAMKGLYGTAALVTFIAMLADSLDGRVARITNTVSQFGAHFDSLSDIIAFGVAPALLTYSLNLHSLGKIGWLAAFMYVAATAMRLARFNAQLDSPEVEKRYFFGLPCPAGAGFLAGLTWLQDVYHLHGNIYSITVAVLITFLAIMMVSQIKYRSFKDFDLKGKVPFIAMFIIILIFIAVAIDPPKVLFGVFLLYVFSGPFFAIFRAGKKEKFNKEKH